MVSLTGIWNGIKSASSTAYNDALDGASNANEAVQTGSSPGIELKRRHVLEGMAGAGVTYLAGSNNLVGRGADAAGNAWAEAGEAFPYEINFGISRKGASNNGSTPTDTPTDAPEQTEQPTDTSNEEPTTTTPDESFSYNGISEALSEGDNDTRQAFKGYSLTALGDQLEDVSLDEAVENTSDYEPSVMDALEGTNYTDGEFTLGEYSRSVDLVDDIGASGELDQYMQELDNDGEIEEAVFDYIDDLERV